jgi:hypothetical protein
MKRSLRLVALASVFLAGRAAASAPPLAVMLWFDTEDYLLPADDDATLRLARWLTSQGITATFKVVGEKARVLERRGRRDVVAALGKHEIGFHSNFHSTQPTPAQYMSALGWDEGVEEWIRREGPGIVDVQRIFGVKPSCYGQPGSSWGPQAHGAIKRLGLPVYLDWGKHLGLDGRPHYYAGTLTLFGLEHTLRAELGGAKDLEAARATFRAAREKLAAEGGGLISIYYHPNEFIQKEFWDAPNFGRGANPPREDWRPPGVVTAKESQARFAIFEEWIRSIKAYPEVRFITASQAARLYHDGAQGRPFAAREIVEIAAGVGNDVGFQRRGDHALAASEVLSLLAHGATGHPRALAGTPLGPSSAGPVLAAPIKTSGSQFARTTADVAAYIDHHQRVPSTVWAGSVAVPPEAFLAALARELAAAREPGSAEVEIRPTRLAAAAHVTDDGPVLWDWPIFPPGFRAPAMMELAKRQSWTIKPAIADPRALGWR